MGDLKEIANNNCARSEYGQSPHSVLGGVSGQYELIRCSTRHELWISPYSATAHEYNLTCSNCECHGVTWRQNSSRLLVSIIPYKEVCSHIWIVDMASLALERQWLCFSQPGHPTLQKVAFSSHWTLNVFKTEWRSWLNWATLFTLTTNVD